MKKLSALFAGVAVAASSVIVAAPASAAGSYDPNVTRIANPANVCKSIPGSIEHFAAMTGQTIDTSGFDYVGCVTTLAQGEAFVEPAEIFGSPYVPCDALAEFGVTYPYVFHNQLARGHGAARPQGEQPQGVRQRAVRLPRHLPRDRPLPSPGGAGVSNTVALCHNHDPVCTTNPTALNVSAHTNYSDGELRALGYQLAQVVP